MQQLNIFAATFRYGWCKAYGRRTSQIPLIHNFLQFLVALEVNNRIRNRKDGS